VNRSVSKRVIFVSEVRQSFVLAIPLIFSFFVQAASGFIGTLMIARLGKDALAASVLVYAIYLTFAVFFFGILSAIGILVAHNCGAKNNKGVGLAVSQGVLLSIVICIPIMLLLILMPHILFLSHQSAHVLLLGKQYLHSLVFCILPLALLVVMEQFLIGIEQTKLVLMISILQIPIEILVNYIFIFGKFGFPALGIAGLGYGYATVFSVATLLIALFLSKSKASKEYRPFSYINQFHQQYFFELLKVGFPIGCMYVIEVAFFTVIAFLMGRISNDALAAHQIAIQFIELVMVIPYGISHATAVRVGKAVGQNNKEKVKEAVFANMFIGYCILIFVVVYFVFWPTSLIALDVNLHNINYSIMIHLATVFIGIGSFGLLIDNFRYVIFGALRGLKDTSFPMYITAAAFWFIGLPIAYILAFNLKINGAGLWIGILVGMIVASILLYMRLNRFLQKTRLADLLI